MDPFNKKFAIIFIGPPGSGKDTQSELLARELNYIEIKSSRIISEKFKNADPDDEVMNREKELNRSGQLNSKELVEGWVTEAIKEAGEKGKGIVGNGWPREASEAQKEMAAVEEFFKPDEIKIVCISISEEETIRRNSIRRVCELNGHPILDTEENKSLTSCPIDGSPIITRDDDDPETIKKRYRVYAEETKPVIDFLSKEGYNIVTVDGEKSIEDVHRDILVKLW